MAKQSISSFIKISQRFGKLKTISPIEKENGFPTAWTCECECGNITIVSIYKLVSGHTKSCGCLLAQHQKTGSIKHGMTVGGTIGSEYHTWENIKKRTTNPNHDKFPYYGGRGIVVCERWKIFSNFYADMGPKPGPEYSIERIDNDGPYSPDNCYWATRIEQANNRRNNHIVHYDNKSMTLAQWARYFNVSSSTLVGRLRRKSIEEVFSQLSLNRNEG